MQVKIQVIATAIETKPTTKGSYQQLEVTYKDLDKNKVGSKKIMSFTKPETIFKTLSVAKGGDVFDIELIKNEQSGYWDWTNVAKSSAQSQDAPTTRTSAAAGTAGASTTKGGWETPEERAKKQIYIVRQSSISAAVNALSVGSKVHPKAEEVIEYARTLEAYVFESDSAQAVARQDVGSVPKFDDLEDPLPF